MESFISNFGTIDTTTHNILMRESRRKSAVLPHEVFSGQKRVASKHQSGNQYILDKCILIWDDSHTSIHWVWRYETGPVGKTFSKPSPQWKGYGSTLSRSPSGPGGRTCRSHELLIVDNDSQNGAPTYHWHSSWATWMVTAHEKMTQSCRVNFPIDWKWRRDTPLNPTKTSRTPSETQPLISCPAQVARQQANQIHLTCDDPRYYYTTEHNSLIWESNPMQIGAWGCSGCKTLWPARLE